VQAKLKTTLTSGNKSQKITGFLRHSIELDKTPFQNHIPKPLQFSDMAVNKIDHEIECFLLCKIIELIYSSDEGEFISNIFARPKKDGKLRIILNLKKFNDNMQHIHFKMETLKNAVNLMTKDCYFGSVDISDAFYSIPM
jgi:hypothetical protein